MSDCETRSGGDLRYTVVFNREGRYALWPGHRPPPAGWREAGKTGSEAECLAYVREVWTDLRPQARIPRSAGRD